MNSTPVLLLVMRGVDVSPDRFFRRSIARSMRSAAFATGSGLSLMLQSSVRRLGSFIPMHVMVSTGCACRQWLHAGRRRGIAAMPLRTLSKRKRWQIALFLRLVPVVGVLSATTGCLPGPDHIPPGLYLRATPIGKSSVSFFDLSERSGTCTAGEWYVAEGKKIARSDVQLCVDENAVVLHRGASREDGHMSDAGFTLREFHAPSEVSEVSYEQATTQEVNRALQLQTNHARHSP